MFRKTAIVAVVTVGSMFALNNSAQAQFKVGVSTPKASVVVGVGGHHHHHHPHHPHHHVPLPSYYTPVYPVAPILPVLPEACGWVVEYRTCSHELFRPYTTVFSFYEARRMERSLELMGYQARLRRI